MMWSMPTTRSIATAAAVCYGVFAAWVLGGSAGPQTARTVDDIALVAVSVLALVFAVAAARSTTGRLQSGWTVFSLALFAWTVGEVLWTIDELGKVLGQGTAAKNDGKDLTGWKAVDGALFGSKGAITKIYNSGGRL